VLGALSVAVFVRAPVGEGGLAPAATQA